MPAIAVRLSLSAAALLSACGAAAPAAAQGWAESWFDNVTYSSPGSFNDQTRGYVTAGGMSGRVNAYALLGVLQSVDALADCFCMTDPDSNQRRYYRRLDRQ